MNPSVIVMARSEYLGSTVSSMRRTRGTGLGGVIGSKASDIVCVLGVFRMARPERLFRRFRVLSKVRHESLISSVELRIADVSEPVELGAHKLPCLLLHRLDRGRCS